LKTDNFDRAEKVEKEKKEDPVDLEKKKSVIM
jgi:hypothetical protein